MVGRLKWSHFAPAPEPGAMKFRLIVALCCKDQTNRTGLGTRANRGAPGDKELRLELEYKLHLAKNKSIFLVLWA